MRRPDQVSSSAVKAPEVPQRYHCRPPWNPVRAYSAAVEGKFAVGQPGVGGDRGRRRHFRRDGLGHGAGKIHHIIGRQLCQFVRGPRLERIGLVGFPVRALVMVIGAQEIMHALRRALHVGVGLARRVVPLIMLARAAAAPRVRDARGLRVSVAAAHRRCRTAAAAVRRTARSSARPIETHRAAPARTMRRPNCRNRARPRHRRER